MTTQTEALKLALDELAVRFSEGWHEGIKIDASDIMLLNKAAQALAQPEPSPEWMTEEEQTAYTFGWFKALESQRMAQPEQEPAIFLKEWSDWRSMVVQNLMRHGGVDKDLARRLAHFYQDSAPQRTWVGLTEDEAFACQGRNYFETYKAIEAKLKEKNI